MIPTLPKFDIPVELGDLNGPDGNAFMILGKVTKALKSCGVDQATRDAFVTEATAGDYNNLLDVASKWVNTGLTH